MNKSFYHYLIKFRQPTIGDELSQFANAVYNDHSFPKYSEDYQELSSYLELNGDYLSTVAFFDYVWEMYVEAEKI